MHTQLSKWGNSAAVRLNKQTLEDADLSLGDTLQVRIIDGTIILIPSRKSEDLDELLSRITPKNVHSETDWGEPRGNEIS
jgi:antitoxin MazE